MDRPYGNHTENRRHQIHSEPNVTDGDQAKKLAYKAINRVTTVMGYSQAKGRGCQFPTISEIDSGTYGREVDSQEENQHPEHDVFLEESIHGTYKSSLRFRGMG
jgi:hypothetical protein